jgi:hypothetical protein
VNGETNGKNKNQKKTPHKKRKGVLHTYIGEEKCSNQYSINRVRRKHANGKLRILHDAIPQIKE